MNPEELAAMLAVIIDRSPEAAALIKNHIRPERLKQLLCLEPDNQTEFPIIAGQ